MTKFSSLARARVIGPEGGAWSGGASGGAREGAAGVDVLVVSSSSFVRQPNGPECTKIVGNAAKHQFRANGMDRVRSLRKISMRLRGMNFCTSSSRFTRSFVRQPNGSECIQIVLTRQNVSLGSNGVDRVRSLRKIPKPLRGTNFCTSSAHFCTDFRNATKQSQMHPNSMKCTKTSFYGPMGWIGSLCCEKFRRDFVARTFALVRHVLPRVS